MKEQNPIRLLHNTGAHQSVSKRVLSAPAFSSISFFAFFQIFAIVRMQDKNDYPAYYWQLGGCATLMCGKRRNKRKRCHIYSMLGLEMKPTRKGNQAQITEEIIGRTLFRRKIMCNLTFYSAFEKCIERIIFCYANQNKLCRRQGHSYKLSPFFKTMAQFVLIYSTFEKPKHAQRMANLLLTSKLAGCAMMFPAQSMYWWKGTITIGNETILLLKTTKSLAVKAKKELTRKHTYSIPCILDWSAGVNPPYWNWLLDVTQKKARRKEK